MKIVLRRIFVLIGFVSMFLAYNTSHAQVYAKNGMVVSESEIASSVGTEILKKGGNAIDASVATAFAMAVTFPQAGNIGGGGFLVFKNLDGESTTIDFREKAPLAASLTMFQDQQGRLIKGANHHGLKSVGVPGTVAGLFMAHEKYGVLPWKDLVQPAVDLAENGFELTWALYDWAKKIEEWDPSKDILINYFRNEQGAMVQPGEIWKQRSLANTLKLIRDHGQDGFYKGPVADEITAYMKANGGIITKTDLLKYTAIEREALKGSYKEFEIITMPPPSSGGVALIEMMNLIEQADMESIEFNSTEYVHLMAEVMRRAFADRAQHLGDPDFNFNMPLEKLVSKDFAKTRYRMIDQQRASVSDSSKFGQLYDGSSTTHISIVDKDGSAVSLTYTLEHSFGSGMGSSKLGFIFNNEMGDFNPVEGLTTNKGLIGTQPNLIAPEKRMLSSMSPTIVAKNGKTYLVIGSPGGRTIINTVFQTVLNVLAYDMPIDKAIEVMKIHQSWLPDVIFYEKELLSPDTRDALAEMGHTLKSVDYLGRLAGIKYDEKNERYAGASDTTSKDGGAVGY
ncbi:MAG: gamma-glutamyltransferase [Reichenbachiella sp.]|uniref:gamma-glutamyltransferase n=1 Tax=Reichenbachiella sp. TaxID=2184521 RepID=UPI0032636249